MLAKTFSAALQGIDGAAIEVEAALQNTLPRIQIIGLPGDIVRESADRVQASLTNLGYDVPTTRILVHLSPASTKKQGSQCDVAIAMCVLAAEKMLAADSIAKHAFLGELSLDGRIHRIRGAVALIEALERDPRVKHVYLPRGNEWEAGLVGSQKARLVGSLSEVLGILRGTTAAKPAAIHPIDEHPPKEGPTFDDVVGQSMAKRALEIALAGRHHLLMVGPPGVGKSLIASCSPRLLPPLSRDEMVEVAKNHALDGSAERDDPSRPFRSPHHSLPSQALLGGGSRGVISAGEITLAHAGILFLDEFPEFRKDAIEGLREPLQSGRVFLHRVGKGAVLPARFTLIAAMNPCPCGFSLGSGRRCRCPLERVVAYRKRLSGPILDRIDLCCVLGLPTTEKRQAGNDHAAVRERIAKAIAVQAKRFSPSIKARQNGDADVDLQSSAFHLTGEKEKSWFEELKAGGMTSYRGLHKLLRVARTIADLEGQEMIRLAHLLEARGFRCPDSFL